MAAREPADTPRGLVIFRCDGGVESGLGHVSRCLGLAEALAERGVDALFVGRFSDHASGMLEAGGADDAPSQGAIGSAADLVGMRVLAEQHKPMGFVVDSYAIDAEYLEALGATGTPIIVIDDFAKLQRYPCAAVLNFTVSAPHLPYPEGHAPRLLGPPYTLVRRALRQMRRKPPPPDRATRALIALGGVDRHRLSGRVLDALAQVDTALEVHVATALDSLADLYAWADVCISGGGLMKYEAAWVGVPTGVLPQTEGEAADSRRFAAMGLVVDLGGPQVPDRPLRSPLTRLLGDAALRRSLHEAGAPVFGFDPTARAADEVLTRLGAPTT